MEGGNSGGWATVAALSGRRAGRRLMGRVTLVAEVLLLISVTVLPLQFSRQTDSEHLISTTSDTEIILATVLRLRCKIKIYTPYKI